MKYMLLLVWLVGLLWASDVRAAACPLAENVPYRSPLATTVYVVRDGCQKRPIFNPDVYFSHFSSWESVVFVEQPQLDAVPNHPLQFLPWGPRRVFTDGSLLKTVDDPRVYLILGTKKYPFENEGSFKAFAYTFAMVEDVEPSVLAKYSTQTALEDVGDAPVGLAFKYAESPTVYVLVAGTNGVLGKSPVTTYEALQQMYRADHLAVLPTPVEPLPEPTPEPQPQPEPEPTPEPEPEPSLAPGNYTASFSFGGLTRSYLLHVPSGYTGNTSVPLLVHLHGGMGTAEQGADATDLSEVADREGFIVVYGQASAVGLLGLTNWNAGGCCGGASATNVDDVGYVREVVRRVKEQVNVASTRVYASGMSNGGMLANRLACEAADVFAGVAAVAGTIQVSTCNPSRKIPVLMVHGTADERVPYAGGPGVADATYVPVEQVFADWSARNSCQGPVLTTAVTPRVADGTTVDRIQNTSCPGGQEVVLYRVNGGGHGWPGGTAGYNALESIQPSQAMSASETIATFFGF